MQVGLLDIDICGPSIPKMLGLEGEEIHSSASGWSPVYVNDNLGVMSIGFLLPDKDDAVIWRGPRKNGLIKQFLKVGSASPLASVSAFALFREYSNAVIWLGPRKNGLIIQFLEGGWAPACLTEISPRIHLPWTLGGCVCFRGAIGREQSDVHGLLWPDKVQTGAISCRVRGVSCDAVPEGRVPAIRRYLAPSACMGRVSDSASACSMIPGMIHHKSVAPNAGPSTCIGQCMACKLAHPVGAVQHSMQCCCA